MQFLNKYHHLYLNVIQYEQELQILKRTYQHLKINNNGIYCENITDKNISARMYEKQSENEDDKIIIVR